MNAWSLWPVGEWSMERRPIVDAHTHRFLNEYGRAPRFTALSETTAENELSLIELGRITFDFPAGLNPAKWWRDDRLSLFRDGR